MDKWLKRLLGWCAMILICLLLLTWAVDLLTRLLPWLIGIGLAVGIGWLAHWWWKHRQHW